jgi:hypothetical protein
VDEAQSDPREFLFFNKPGPESAGNLVFFTMNSASGIKVPQLEVVIFLFAMLNLFACCCTLVCPWLICSHYPHQLNLDYITGAE